MDINAVTTLLDESEGRFTYDIVVPSTGESYAFKGMQTGTMKTMAKYAMDSSEDQNKIQLLKLAFIKALCVDGIDVTKLTITDTVSVLAQIISANILDPISLNVTCNNPECNKETVIHIPFDEIIECCDNAEHTKYVYEITDQNQNMEFKFTLCDMYLMDVIELAKITNDIQQDNNEFDTTLPLLTVREISINDEEVEGFTDLSVADKLGVFTRLSPYITLSGETSIRGVVEREFNLKQLMPVFACPFCKNKWEGVITTDNFFTI